LTVDRSTVVRWERAETEPHPSMRPMIAQKLGISLDELDELLSHVAVVGHPHAPRADVSWPEESSPGSGTTERRTFGGAGQRGNFTIATALSVLGVAGPLTDLITDDDSVRSASAGVEHLRLLETAVDQIERRDAAVGGDTLCGAVTRLHHTAGLWLDGGSPTLAVRDALQTVRGDLACWVGWLAFDADRRDQARRYLQEAVVEARLTDDPFLEVRALTYMCLLTLDGRPRESLQCAQAAQRLAAGWSTPRLAALLHLRAARAHAAMADERAFHREWAKATTLLDQATRDDEPTYVHFVGTAEASGIAGLSYLAMGRPDRAATMFRAIIERPDPSYRRNVGYYTVRLAEALGRQGDLAGASAAGRDAIPLVAGLDSGRTARFLGQFRRAIQPHLASSVEARDFADLYDDWYPGGL
jgi:hypothetical protein